MALSSIEVRMRAHPLVAIVFSFAVAGCSALSARTEQAAPAPAAARDAAPAAHDNLNAVAWMQASLEYRLIAGQTWRSALAQLDRALKSPDWDALTQEDRDVPAKGLPPAVIVDVDETVLDNSPYQARLARGGGEFDPRGWSLWVKEEAALPIPGALEFARAATARGVVVYYLSNRAQDLGPATLANLRKAGFPIQHDDQFLGLGTVVAGCEDKSSEKGCRRRSVGRAHRILMQVGDQIGDLVTVTENTPRGREAAVRPYLGWIGERWFVLPNPSYGAWESALFGNDWSRSEEDRRRAKFDALRY